MHVSAGPRSLPVAGQGAAAAADAPAPVTGPALERALLLAALAQLFRALRDPALGALARPPVPGATLPLGARVPGTSLELDPASAAACLGALLHGAPVPSDPLFAPALAAADYAARRAHYEGREPPTLQAMYAALARARAAARALDGASGATRATAPGAVDPWRAARIGGAFAAALLLGASEAACHAAAAAAARDGSPEASLADAGGVAAVDLRACRAAGENAARAVRHALAFTDIAPVAAIAPTPQDAPEPAARTVASLAQAESEFAAAVAALFPARYVPAILAAVADDATLRASPVDALLAFLVRN